MGATAMLAGTVLSTGSKIYSGIKQKQSMDAAAGQLQEEAGQSIASGIQQSTQDRLKARYVASNARAHIAAGGLATTGTTAEAITGGIRGQGEYNALTDIYQGEDRAQELETHAAGMRREGDAAATAGWMGGISTAMSGGSGFYSKYGSPFASPSDNPRLATWW